MLQGETGVETRGADAWACRVSAAPGASNLICKECHEGEDEENMLLCDHCDGGWHMYCLDPPLEEIPEGSWYCPTCRVERGEG